MPIYRTGGTSVCLSEQSSATFFLYSIPPFFNHLRLPRLGEWFSDVMGYLSRVQLIRMPTDTSYNNKKYNKKKTRRKTTKQGERNNMKPLQWLCNRTDPLIWLPGGACNKVLVSWPPGMRFVSLRWTKLGQGARDATKQKNILTWPGSFTRY